MSVYPTCPASVLFAGLLVACGDKDHTTTDAVGETSAADSAEPSGSDSTAVSDSGVDHTPQPPVAVLLDVPVKCPAGAVLIDGSTSYSPDAARQVVGWEWSMGPEDRETPSWSFEEMTNQGDIDEIALTVFDDLTERSETTATQVTTNTWPTLGGFQVTGDCVVLSTSPDRDAISLYWRDDCNSTQCACEVAVTVADPDKNQVLVWEPDPSTYGPDTTVSGSTVRYAFPGDYDHSYYSSYCRFGTGQSHLSVSDPCSTDDADKPSSTRAVVVELACRPGTF